MSSLTPLPGVQSDARLVLAARGGDSSCLALLFERYRARLYAMALKLTRCAHVAAS